MNFQWFANSSKKSFQNFIIPQDPLSWVKLSTRTTGKEHDKSCLLWKSNFKIRFFDYFTLKYLFSAVDWHRSRKTKMNLYFSAFQVLKYYAKVLRFKRNTYRVFYATEPKNRKKLISYCSYPFRKWSAILKISSLSLFFLNYLLCPYIHSKFAKLWTELLHFDSMYRPQTEKKPLIQKIHRAFETNEVPWLLATLWRPAASEAM